MALGILNKIPIYPMFYLLEGDYKFLEAVAVAVRNETLNSQAFRSIFLDRRFQGLGVWALGGLSPKTCQVDKHFF